MKKKNDILKNRLNEIIENEISNLISKSQLFEEDNWAKEQNKRVKDAYFNAYNNNEKFRQHVDKIGNHIGVNNKQDSPRLNNNKVYMNNGSSYGYEDFLKNMSTRLMKACETLRNGGIMKPSGAVKSSVMYAPSIDNYKTDAELSNGELENNAELMKCKDLLDLLSLSYLYDIENADKLKIQANPYNIIYNKLSKLDSDDFFETVKKTFDLSYATPQQIMAWAKQGTRYGKLSKNDEKYDEKIKSGNYIQNGDNYFRKGSYGDRFGDESTWKDDEGNPKNAEMFMEIKADYYRSLVEKTINAVYGMDMDMPKAPFTYGNSKLPSSSLIINFTSAHRCPAWNECLIKYACYARASEHNYKSLFAKNKRLNMMWEGSRYDEQLKKELFNLIRIYSVNIGNLLRKANESYKTEHGVKTTPFSGKKFFDIITTEGFGGLPDNVKEILKNDSETKRIQDIRLNEEGDFIGQWLLDAVDEFAGELSEINIKVAAYTCRNLNFDGIKNIIINASTENIGTHQDGSTANAIARRFFAVPEDIYNSMDETYASQVDDNGKPLGEPTIPTYVANEKLFGDKKGRIIPFPQPLYIDGKPTGQLYYKCPCGRGKHQSKKDEKNQSYIDKKFNSYSNPNNLERLKQGKTAQLEGVNCYDCRVCYSEKLKESKMPVVVLVQVHSANSDLFNGKNGQHNKIGKSINYASNNADIMKHMNNESTANNNASLIKENILDSRTSDEAIRQVAKYGEQSVQTHMKQLKKQVQTEAKEQFFNKYKQLFG